MLVDVEDTIVAIGSAKNPAARGVVRVSGSDCIGMLARLDIHPKSDRSSHWIESEIDLGSPLGCVALRVLLWPTTRSYTAQPSAEIHTYGCLPILQAVMGKLMEAGARAARPGEFTLRAFLAGRLDLTQAEAVLGVIDAENRGSLDHALRQLAGNLSQPMERLRSELLDLLADVEAGLDFVDEDIQFIDDASLLERLGVIAAEIEQSRSQLRARTQQSSQFTIALRGLPNVGKSQLLNTLTGKDAAIVADVAGTTRDVVIVRHEIADQQVVFVDTAGIESREGDSIVDQISHQAQQHAERSGKDADMRIWCVDINDAGWETTCAEMESFATSRRRSAVDLWVATKCDSGREIVPPGWIATSSSAGHGIDLLRHAIRVELESRQREESHGILGTAARCRGSLDAAHNAIHAAMELVKSEEGHEYVSSELRLAAASLGEVTGAVYTDDVLDRVFSRFCIGK